MKTYLAIASIFLCVFAVPSTATQTPVPVCNDKATCNKTVGNCNVEVAMSENNETPECLCTDCKRVSVTITITCDDSGSECSVTENRCYDSNSGFSQKCGGNTITTGVASGKTWGGTLCDGACQDIVVS